MSLRLKIPIPSKLNLTDSTLDEARNMIHNFFSVNYSYGAYVEDQVTLSATHPNFLDTLDILTDRIARVRESRGALHVHIYDVPKEDIQLHHLHHFWSRIIPYDKYFGYYNLIIYAHSKSNDARHVHNQDL
jgi:hypothetical protein